MIFDTHCHYNLDPLASDWQKQWQKAQEHGVTKSIVVGTEIESSKLAISLANQNSAFRATIAIHPGEYQHLIEEKNPPTPEVSNLISKQITTLSSLAENKKVVAVGETGLDYFRLPDDSTLATKIKNAQLEAFTAHISLAQKHQLPLVIHVRDQGEEAYHTIISTLKAQSQQSQPFVLHCISGPLSYVKEALELGAYLGVAGNVTYRSAEHIRELVRYAPPDRLLLETDAPFLPPQEFRGKTCEPWMIDLTAEFLRDELNLETEQLFQNATTVFGF